MTAEIAIMNKEAIALATDSAVTGRKVFTSANKLFALSKYHPVGIMIYGNALFMDIPWETVVKIYRKELGNKKFSRLSGYARNFIKFLDNGNELFPIKAQENHLLEMIYSCFYHIKKEIRKKVEENLIRGNFRIDPQVQKQIIKETIKEFHIIWKKTKNIPSIPKNFPKKIMRKYKSLLYLFLLYIYTC